MSSAVEMESAHANSVGTGKGKGKGVAKLTGKGKGAMSSKGYNAYSAEALNDLLHQEVIFDDCEPSSPCSNSQKEAMPLLAELRDLVLMTQSGPIDPAAALIPKIQDIISEAKMLHSNGTAADAVAEDLAVEDVIKAGGLIHATKYDHWPSIKQEGLKGESSIDFVAVSAKSKRGCIAGVMGADLLIYVDIEKATKDGYHFSRHPSHPETIVCDATVLEVKYFSKVVDIRSGEMVWDLSHGGCAKDLEFTTGRLRQMKLYSNSRLRFTLHKAVEIAYANSNALKVSDFGFMDQLHYLGYECTDDFFGRYAPNLRNCGAPVIDIGTGLGGTARYMWEQYGAHVTGIEYQQELSKIYTILNNLLRVPEGELSIESGDFAHMDLEYLGLEGQFAAFTSQLVFLHIADKTTLFEKCANSLKEGAYFMIEDYYMQDGVELSEEDTRLLREEISVPNGKPSTESEYRNLLASNGLVVEEWVDMTDRWCTFIWERCEMFLKARPALEQEHGQEYGAEQAHFYAAVANLFHKLPEGDREARFPNVCQHIKWQPTSESKPQRLRGARIYGRKVTTSKC